MESLHTSEELSSANGHVWLSLASFPGRESFGCQLNISPASRLRRRWSLGGSCLAQFGLLIGLVAWGSRMQPLPRHEIAALPVQYLALSYDPVRRSPLPAPRRLWAVRRAAPLPRPRLAAAPVIARLRPPLPAMARDLMPALHARAPRWSTRPRPRSPMQLGQFGSPNGLRPLAVKAPANTLALGSFGAAVRRSSASAASAGNLQIGGFHSPARASAFTSGGRLHVGAFLPPPAAPRPIAKPDLSVPPGLQAALLVPPRILYKPRPFYTARALRQKVHGIVVLDARLGAHGQIHILRIVRGLPDGLNQAAWQAAQKIRFIPARRNHRPVAWRVRLYISFRLLP